MVRKSHTGTGPYWRNKRSAQRTFQETFKTENGRKKNPTHNAWLTNCQLSTFNNTFHLSSTMMPKAISVALFLSAILRSDAEKKFAVKENRECVVPDVNSGLYIQLGKDNGRVGKCKEKCILNDQCLAFEFKPPRKCFLFYSEIEKVNHFIACFRNNENVKLMVSSHSSFIPSIKMKTDAKNDG